jgi:hypothetical protein
MLLGNPGNPAKQPRQHWSATLPATLPIATAFPVTIDAVTLCEVINLTNPVPIHGPILPAGLTHSLTHRSRHTITTHHASREGWHYIYDAPHRIGNAREARNLFVGRRATAVGGHPTQPRLQLKTISVALQTATQTPKPMFLVQPRSPSYTARQTLF